MSNREKIISPSLLSADFLHLGEQCQMLDSSDAQWFHLDVMDGSFVPNLSYGLPVIKAIRSTTGKVIDVHLMIENAELYLSEYRAAGADIITVHYEAIRHLARTVSAIKESGAWAAVALCPATPIEVLSEILPELDMVLLMSVNPGFGGQKFIPSTVDKLQRLRLAIDERGLKTLIQIDGGVTTANAAMLYGAGADCLVAGNAVFGAENPTIAIKSILGE